MGELAGLLAMSERESRLSELIAAEAARLRSFIRKRVPNDADAEDLLQDVFYEVVAAYRLMAPIERWGAWMFRVARNRIVDLVRSGRRQGFAGGEAAGHAPRRAAEPDELPARSDTGPAARYARGVLLDEIETALEELPAEQREVFVAHEIAGESFKEIAARTGVGVNTLLSRKHYAVVHLRRRLQAMREELARTGEGER